MFGHPHSSISFKTAMDLTLSTKIDVHFHIGNSIPRFRGMYLHSIVSKKVYINLPYIYMYRKYIKGSSYKNTFFIFLFDSTVTAKLDGKTLVKK